MKLDGRDQNHILAINFRKNAVSFIRRNIDKDIKAPLIFGIQLAVVIRFWENKTSSPPTNLSIKKRKSEIDKLTGVEIECFPI